MHNYSTLHLKQFEGLLDGGRKVDNSASVICFASVWNIQKARNVELFQNKNIESKNMVEKVKMHALKWMEVKAKEMEHNIKLWFLNPMASLGFIDE